MMYVTTEYVSGPQIEYETIDTVEYVDAREAPVTVEQLKNVPHGKSVPFRSIYHVGNCTEERVNVVVRAPSVSYAIVATNNYIMLHRDDKNHSAYIGRKDLEFMLCEPIADVESTDIDIGYYYYWR